MAHFSQLNHALLSSGSLLNQIVSNFDGFCAIEKVSTSAFREPKGEFRHILMRSTFNRCKFHQTLLRSDTPSPCESGR